MRGACEETAAGRAAAGRRRGRDDGLAPSFFTRYPPHDCLEGRGVVSGAYAANVSGFRMRGADHAGPREKLSATRSLSAPSERQRTSADETLAFWRVRRAGGTRLAHSKLCSVLAVCELWAGLGGVGIELSGVCGISFAFSLRRLRRLGGSGRLLSCSGATRTSPLRPWPSQPSSWCLGVLASCQPLANATALASGCPFTVHGLSCYHRRPISRRRSSVHESPCGASLASRESTTRPSLRRRRSDGRHP